MQIHNLGNMKCSIICNLSGKRQFWMSIKLVSNTDSHLYTCQIIQEIREIRQYNCTFLLYTAGLRKDNKFHLLNLTQKVTYIDVLMHWPKSKHHRLVAWKCSLFRTIDCQRTCMALPLSIKFKLFNYTCCTYTPTFMVLVLFLFYCWSVTSHRNGNAVHINNAISDFIKFEIDNYLVNGSNTVLQWIHAL